MPADAVSLLVHHQHMTDAMERFHGVTVHVAVVAIKLQADSYARMSLLTRHPDQQILQLGIVRLCWARIPRAVRQEVEQAQTPLGRILTEHDVMRSVQLEGLWQFRPRPQIAELVRVPGGTALYGRTARILVHHAPAIDLLEIVVLPPPSSE
jgi:hypothetical protein